jgi:hypothetical protein
MPDQSGLGRTRAHDDGRKSQTLGADVDVFHAEFSFEHLPRRLAERELIDLRFDRRLLTTQHAYHRRTVADLSWVRRELEGSCSYQAGRNAPLV